jgi:hypothetical protein
LGFLWPQAQSHFSGLRDFESAKINMIKVQDEFSKIHGKTYQLNLKIHE